jgi:hypothetical protein
MARINLVFRGLGWAAITGAAGCAKSAALPRPIAPLAPAHSECRTPSLAAAAGRRSVTVAIADPALEGDPRTDTTLLAGFASDSRTNSDCPADGPSYGANLFVQRISSDAGRDALDGGVDALLTRDPTTIAYATTRSGLSSFALPWDRVYLLVIPVRGDRPNGRADDSLAVSLRVLATDAVRAEARPVGASSPRGGTDCDLAPSETAPVSFPPASLRRVVYAQNDSVSRTLAERLVALALTASSPLGIVAPELTAPDGVTRAGGLAPAAFAHALAAQSEAAYILALPIEDLPACGRAGSLVGMGSPDDNATSRPTERVVPLIETRARLIVRSAVMTPLIDALHTLPDASAARGAP